ncbi:MAG: SAM-dependent chlorinase/fluorinase, partial [Candidatus Marinimicrobia bacterium]|nr:SAM-dependent chlorinase/fluorinase [Candidatus Neomarinimicrobiota bacterium]
GHWEGDALVGRIRTVDGYGNAITNIRADTLTATGWPRRGDYRLRLAGRELQVPLAGTYAEVAPGEVVLVFGSGGYLEVALNQGDFAAAHAVRPGDRLELSPLR